MNLLKQFVHKYELLKPLQLNKLSSLCSQYLTPAKKTNSANNSSQIISRTTNSELINNSTMCYNMVQIREYKTKTRLRKRCKSCYFVWRNGRIYVECEENPRHKSHHIKSILKGYDSIAHGYDVKAERAEKEARDAWKASLL